MFLLLPLLLSVAQADTPDLTVNFKVWFWKQNIVEERAHAKLLVAANAAGFRDVTGINSSRFCSILYCAVTATATGVK